MGRPDFAIIILAAGAAARMRGGDKLLEDVDGEPLLRRQARMARAVTQGPVIIALPPKPHPRYNVLRDLAVTCLPVAAANEGMGASFRTATQALPPDCACSMYLLGDMPDLRVDDLKTMRQAVDLTSQNLIWRGSSETGTPGHPIVFRAALFEALTALEGDTGARDVVASAGARVQLVPLPGNRATLDLDTPEEWAAWRARRVT